MKRQGDLLIIQIDKIPQDAVRESHLILAEGEKTGHRHELNGGTVFTKKDRLYFSNDRDRPIELNHPEHFPIVFPPGYYEVIRQKEYEPQTWRYVID